ncbi:MAG: O-antigen ligase family protein [Alphaproteobacteria bacterium]|nr:O-antigen ligase family protein [Alphaproteobacteria bacterium]
MTSLPFLKKPVIKGVVSHPSGHLLALWFVALGCVAMWSPRTTVAMLIIAAVFLLLFRALKRPVETRISVGSTALFGFSVLLICVGAFWSVADSAYFQAAQLLGLAVPSVVILLVLHALPKGDLLWARHGLIAGGIAFTVLMLFELLTDQAAYRAIRGIGPGEMLDPNALNRPEVLAALFIWPVAGALWQIGWRKAAVVLPLAYTAITFTLTSQSTVLGMIAGLVVFVAAVVGWRVVRWVLVVGIAAAFLLAVPAAHWMAEGGLNEVGWLPFSAKHRVLIWDYVATLVADHPYFGWGLDASRVLNDLGGRLEDRPSVELLPLHPHNAMLQVWLELGVYGILVSLTFVLGLVGQIDRVPRDVRPFAAGLFACALGIASVAYGVWQTWWLAGGLTAVAGMVVVAQMARAERSQL